MSGGELKFSQTYFANSAMLQVARSDVVECLKTIGAPTNLLIDIEIALGEVLQNIVRHAFKGCETSAQNSFLVQLFLRTDHLELHVIDSAAPLVDLSFMHVARSPSEEGGMGLELIKKLVSKYSIEPLANGNLHKLSFNGFLTPT